MSGGNGFFGLSGEDVSKLDLNFILQDNGILVTSSAGDLFEVRHDIQSDSQRDLKKYWVYICSSGFSGEAQTSRIKSNETGETLGYIFPITAFRNNSNIDGDWAKRFADVGFRSVVTAECLAAFSLGISIDQLKGRSVYLDEILPDTFSLLVVGFEAASKANISREILELMLLKHEIVVLRNYGDFVQTPVSRPWRLTLSLSLPSELIATEADVFIKLIKNADRDQIGIGAFLSLYQALEFCIDHIFSWSVTEIATSGVDVWELKSRLFDATSEKQRLAVLDSKCLANLRSRESLAALKESCGRFLSSVSVEYKEDADWFSLLYKARNIIVHSQIKMMRTDSVPLKELNMCLRAAAFDILFAFDKPVTSHSKNENVLV